MKSCLYFCGLLCTIAVLFACQTNPMGPEPDQPIDDFLKIEQSLVFKGVRSIVQPPCQIQFTFALRNADDQAVFFEQSDLSQRVKILENDIEIDYNETNFFVNTARTLMQDIVLVLDFSNSVLALNAENASATEAMIAGSKSIIRALGVIDRLAIVEFHDRYQTPQVLSYFSSDTTALLAAIEAFSQRQIDYGASRAWDAAKLGLDLFPTTSRVDAQRLLLIISDGKDTSSRTQPQELIQKAREQNVQIFAADLNASQGSPILQKLANETDGLYLAISPDTHVRTRLADLAESVSCQYQVSYISLLQQPQPTVCVQIEHAGQLNSFSKSVDLGAVIETQKDDRIGRLTYDAEMPDANHAIVTLRLEHTPRNINAFRFKIATSQLQQVQIIPQTIGGLLDRSWQLSHDSDGWFVLRSASVFLPFGAAGALVRAEYATPSGSNLRVPFLLDNSIYSNEKQFNAPDTLILGLRISNPQPMHGSEGIERRPLLSWEVEAGSSQDLVFDVFLDSEAPVLRQIATGIRETEFAPPTTLAANKTHYWKVVARIDGNHYSSPIFQFKTGD